MYKFSQFEIKVPTKGFEGDKVKIDRILNREIVVHDFKIEDSKIKAYQDKGAGKCLHLQISYNNEMHVVFTSSGPLIEVIQQVPRDKFPFTTTINKENGRYLFT